MASSIPDVELRGDSFTPGQVTLISTLWIAFWTLAGVSLIVFNDVFAGLVG